MSPLLTVQKRLWWLFATLVLTPPVAAQSDWVDKSPHKTGFVTVNGVRLHYLDWGGAGETLLAGRIIMTTSHLGSPISFACLDSPGAATANLK